MYLNEEISREYQRILQEPITRNTSEEEVAEAIADVVEKARHQGQSLEELLLEVLAEDAILDEVQRRWLSKIVTQAWKSLPE
jgi:hypothetical protein